MMGGLDASAKARSGSTVSTVEYIVRLCCCNYRPSPNAVGAMGVLRYVFKPMNLIDLLAIAPFWMEQLLHTHAKTEVVRMARMTRIFR